MSTRAVAELSCHASMMRPARAVPARAELLKGLWQENPVLVHMLGLCPTLAVTNSVANGIVMGLATGFVLVASSLLVSSLRRVVPGEIRISSYVLIIATFVSVAELIIQATVPDIHKALGPFVALIIVNCIILGRQEAFASKAGVGRAGLDALGMSGGFMIALLLMSSIRELLGSGTLLGVPVLGPSWEPWVIMVLPPGGFFTLAFILLISTWVQQRRARRSVARRRTAPAPAGHADPPRGIVVLPEEHAATRTGEVGA